ncbi:MAG TPA: DUF4388 domain-containing protein [Myxococcota bacterium]|nr:DUF4388 domain-containing protein [Myxococcota bacterium]
MSVGLSGNLKDFGLADVFQLIGQQRKTGVLELRSKKSRVQLVFDRGAVVSAAPAGGRESDSDPLAEMLVRCGLLTRERAVAAAEACKASAQPLTRVIVDRGWIAARELARVQDVLTRDTIFDVLRWTQGSFDFLARPVEHERDPASLLGAEQILMDGLRMLDEWRELVTRVPADATVFARVGDLESYTQKAGEESPARQEAARRLFGLIDGRLSMRRVIDLALVGNFEGLRIFTALQESHAIEAVRIAGGSAAGLGRGELSLVPFLKGVAASVIPISLLAGAVWFAARHPAPTVPAHPIVRSSLESLREGHATRRLSAAVDTYRLLEGRSPDHLEALLRRGVVGADALAAPEGRPYYSALRADGLILLAPEH